MIALAEKPLSPSVAVAPRLRGTPSAGPRRRRAGCAARARRSGRRCRRCRGSGRAGSCRPAAGLERAAVAAVGAELDDRRAAARAAPSPVSVVCSDTPSDAVKRTSRLAPERRGGRTAAVSGTPSSAPRAPQRGALRLAAWSAAPPRLRAISSAGRCGRGPGVGESLDDHPQRQQRRATQRGETIAPRAARMPRSIASIAGPTGATGRRPCPPSGMRAAALVSKPREVMSVSSSA